MVNMTEPEFTFLGKWIFSACLEDRLKKFTISKTHAYAVKKINTASEVSTSNEETEEIEEIPGGEIEDVQGENPIPHTADINLEAASQSFALCTQNCTKLVANLREGPISYEELNRLSDDDVAAFMKSGSDDVVFNFCESVCLLLHDKHEFVVFLCKEVLLPKIKNGVCSRTLLPSFKKAFEVFPSAATSYVVLPLLGDPESLCKLDPFLIVLEDECKKVILKSLLDADLQIIEEYHIPLIQSLLVVSTNKDSNEKLVDLLLVSGHNLQKSTAFGKLLVNVIEKIGLYLEAEGKEKLSHVVQAHNSILKGRIKRALQSLPS